MADISALSGDLHGLTRPIVDVWKGLLNRAKEAKKRFDERGAQIMSFYSGGPTAMWDPGYMQRFMGGNTAITPPRFKITLNIAFEQVAILGPLLFWEMAARKVAPHRSLSIDPSALAGGNPELQAYFENLAQQQAMDDARNEIRSQVQEHALNYFQLEQPGGGLVTHSEIAIFEALTKGAGFLKTENYRFPFSERTLVGSFFQSVDDVLVDPDCTDPLWTTADWIAIRHRTRVSVTEEHFGLPPGSLREHASSSSNSAAYQAGTQPDTKVEVAKDLVEWYEVFSRAGFGNKLVSKYNENPIADEFDSVRGATMVGGKPVRDDFVYLCICPSCKYPLNLPAMAFDEDYATPEWVKTQTDWPTDYWRDNKWPVEMLWLYPHSGTSPWPEPPLAPALGELTCLNILMSAYVQEAFEGRQTIIGHRKGAIADLNGLLTSDKSPLAVEIDPQFKETIAECIQFLKRPEVNGDLPKTIEFLLSMVEKRTGLREELYGGNSGANPRSATEYQGKMQTVNIRPESMQKKVAAWQSRVADKEVFCSYIHVSSSDIAELLGPLGVVAWDELVTNDAPEAILRGARCVVEASEIRRPNKAKDMMDLQGMQQYLLPILAGQMAQTGDVRPTNGFIKAMGKAGEMDVREFLLPEQPPNQTAEQMQQAELAKTQAETEKLLADADKSRADASGQGEQRQMEAAIKQQTAEHALSVKERTAQMQMAQKSEQHAQTMEQRRDEARQKLGLQLMQNHQKLQQNAANHMQQTAIANDDAMNQAKRGNLISYQKMLMSQAQHDQRMSQTGGNV